MKNETIILKRPLRSRKFVRGTGGGLEFPANTPLQIIKIGHETFAEHPTFKNIYHRVNPKNIKHENVCRIRRDLIKKNIGVPVTYFFLRSDRPYQYRWTGIGGSVFQVWHRGQWNTAESIDFDFK